MESAMTWQALDEFCGQPFWDYDLTWNTTSPDITLCMQQTLLSWIPCAILWVLFPLELFLQKPLVKTIPWSGINITRMIVAVGLAVICLANMMDTCFNRRSETMFNALILSNAVKFATFVLSVIIMALNKKRGMHTSGVLFVFWFGLMACEIISYRSALLQLKEENRIPDESAFIFQMIYFPLLVTELVLSSVADIKKPIINLYEAAYRKEKECPEQNASFLSKLVFWWFNKLAILGWKKPLTLVDLWQLNPEDRTEHIASKFDKHWRHERSWEVQSSHVLNSKSENGTMEKEPSPTEDVIFSPKEIPIGRQQKQVHIVLSLCKTFWAYFSLGSICKFFSDCLQFMNPILLELLINHVKSDEPLWKGILFSFLLLGNGCLQSILLGHYFQRMFVLGMRVRTALISAIYQKSLVLSSSSRRGSTIGEIVNLMSVDSQRFMDLMTYLNMLWSAPFQIFVAVLMLWKILGPSVLSGLFVMIILLPANAYIASRAKRLQVDQMKYKDERVKLVSEVLSGIKVLKLYAWEEAFKKKIIGIRDKEAHQLWKIAYLNSIAVLLWNCCPFFVALASFATYVLVDEKNILDAKTAFVSLSLFNILRFPLTMLPHLITTLVMVNVSVKRINSFMNSEELENYIIKGSSSDQPVVVQDGYFSWTRNDKDEGKAVLQDINLTIEKGTLVAVVGQVGCGKSSLLSAILGDMEKLKGQVFVNGSTALVSQQPWIQNATLQDNIVFSHPFHKSTYENVLEACGLLPDLAVLPGGDQTEIGEKGINLSGGQKQRVSLARAVYSSADIFLLDDPLSAVDSHVGRHIFEKVIGKKGILRNKTRILVTHGLTYLSQTDVIVVMKEGMIAEMGTFQQLIDRKGPFADFLAQYLQGVETSEEDLEVLEDIGQKNPELLRSISERSSESDCLSDRDDRRQSILSINRSPRSPSVQSDSKKTTKNDSKKESIKEERKLIQSETAETGEVLWSVYVHYMKAVKLKWVTLIFSSYVVMQLFSVGSNVWLSEWGSDEVGLNGTQNLTQRDLRLGVYGALGVGQALFVVSGSFIIGYATLLAANSLHANLLTNVLRSPMAFFDTTPIGRIVNRFSKDVDTMDVTIPMTIRSWLSCLLQVVATIILISIQTPMFLSVIVPIGLIYYFIQRFYVATSRQLKRLESITRSPIYSHFSETLAGCSTIRAYGIQDRFCKHSNTLVDNNQVCYYPSTIANRWLAIRLEFCGNCIIFFSALFAVLNKNSLEPGEVGLSLSYALMITQTLNWLVRMNSELETNIVAVERVLEYSETSTEAAWIIPDAQISEGWPQFGHIQLENYCTRYRNGLELVLKGITCNILPREKVGIVGRTGAGKSSLTLSLFRIIEAASGTITVDGVSISKIGLHQLRSKITIIPQDPVLFSGTLRMNLDPFSWYSDEQIWEALEHAHLKAFVSTLDDGLSHEIVEGGENISVGQRQLVCLARALLRKTKVLVLDEATAAVDLETDDLIQATISREFSDSTVLTIAHRLNTVMDYDRIMVLHNGQIAEFDPPETLLKNHKSIFYEMAKDANLV